MISFCRKSVHSLLSLTTANTNQTPNHDGDDDRNNDSLILNPNPNRSKLGLITLITDPSKTAAAVLESSSLHAAKPSPPEKKDPGGIGFIDDIGGGVDGLMSCTESLGFESSDERRVDDDDVDNENNNNNNNHNGRESFYGSLMKRSSRRRREAMEAKKFPPPLPSLDRNGRPSFFLRPVRKDGRLELTEVRINHRPEILRAYRGDGRLRLHFIRDQDQDNTGDNIGDLDCIQEEPEIVQEDDDDNNNNNNNRLISNNNNSGEGFRRCHDEVNQNDKSRHHRHHHQNQLWRSQRHCVITTR